MCLVLFIWINVTIVSVCWCQLTCDEGWIEYNNKCYFFSGGNHLKNRDQAIGKCREMDSYLVSIPDEATNSFLFHNRPDITNYWIGLRQFDNSAWAWNDGTVADNIPDGVSELYGTGTACAMFRNGKYYGRHCENYHKAVCERDIDPDDTINWQPHKGHWYRLLGSLNAMSAARECISNGGYLVRPTSESERQFVMSISSDDLWVGLTRLIWDDGTGFNWNNYTGAGGDLEYPDSLPCVRLHKKIRKWKEKSCYQKFRFICAHDLSTATTMPPTRVTVQTTNEIIPSPTKTSTIHTTPTTITTTSEISEITPSPTSISVFTTSTSALTTTMVKPTSTNHVATLFVSTQLNNTTTNEDKDAVSYVENKTTITELQISSDHKAIHIVLYIIYTLVVIMLATDLVLLVIYLKLRKPTVEESDDVSQKQGNSDKISFDEISGFARTADAVLTSPTANTADFNKDIPIYAVPNQKQNIT